MFFPGPQEFADALYKIGEAEIGYACVRIAPVAYTALMMPHSGMNILNTTALRSILSETLAYPLTFVLACNSAEEVAYQEAVVKKIVLDYDGFMMDVNKMGPMASFMPLNFLRVSIIPLAFRPGGIFGTCLDGNEALDTQMKWVDAIAEAKVEFMDREAIMEDGGNNPYFVPYENNTWAHCEVLYAYSVDNKEALDSLNPIEYSSTLNAIRLHMTPLSAFIPPVRKALSPLAGNYNDWQKKISASLDPGKTADVGFYTDEADFAFDRIDPAKRGILKGLIEKFKWTESGPPD
jgi:hypothetical protein